MVVQQYTPTRLTGLVHAIWEQQADVPANWQILPSGYVELIFNLGPPMENLQGKRVGGAFNPTESFCFLSGLHTRPLYMSYSRFHVMGVQMHPLAVKALFRMPCGEVRDWAVAGELILTEMAEIEDRLRGGGDFISQARWLEHYLAGRLRESSELHTAFRIATALRRVIPRLHAGERVNIGALTGYSRMHTGRLFNDWFGLAPARTLRLCQFTHALRLMHVSVRRLTDIGLESGFYDQAHFIRTFREFAGMTPGAYKRNLSPVVGQLPF